MKIEKLNIDGKKNSIEVLDKIFAVKINKQLISNVLYKSNANYKGRKAKTKQQNEIRGSTSKIYAQKGTGNARHASRKAPIFVGGGVAHGPKGELNYKKRKLNKSEKKLSVASLINDATPIFFSFLFSFLVLYAVSPLGPCAIPPPTKIGAFLLACLALPVPFWAYILEVDPVISFFCFVFAFLPL